MWREEELLWPRLEAEGCLSQARALVTPRLIFLPHGRAGKWVGQHRY